MKKLALFAFLSMGLIASEISIEKISARQSMSGKNGAIFMSIKNGLDADIKLISASSSVSDSVELHTHKMVDGMMAMTRLNSIDIPKNSEVELRPGGLHIMLMGLKKPLNVGDSVDLVLNFNTGRSIKIDDISVTDGRKTLFLEK